MSSRRSKSLFLAILEAFILKIFRGSMVPESPRTLAPGARAKNAFGIIFSPPIAKMLRGPCLGMFVLPGCLFVNEKYISRLSDLSGKSLLTQLKIFMALLELRLSLTGSRYLGVQCVQNNSASVIYFVSRKKKLRRNRKHQERNNKADETIFLLIEIFYLFVLRDYS